MINDENGLCEDFWPDWLEKHRVNDDLFARAYESFPSSCRAAIKTALALARFHFGDVRGYKGCEYAQAHQGFWRKCQSQPKKWAIIVFNTDFDAAARLCAAAVVPILADVKNICAISAEGIPSPEALLTLELCGIEDVFSISWPEMEKLSGCMPLNGAIVSPDGCPGWPLLTNLANNIDAAFYRPCGPPSISVKDAGAFDERSLVFCLGKNDTYNTGSNIADAVYLSIERARACLPEGWGLHGNEAGVRLFLTPGCEGFWLFDNLGPEFFQTCSCSFGLWHPEDRPK